MRAESTDLAIREVYVAYHNEMGGEGAAPERPVRKPTPDGNVIQLQKRPTAQSRPVSAHHSTTPSTRKILRALLIFAAMLALIVLYRFVTH
jgi:hypothetical protein